MSATRRVALEQAARAVCRPCIQGKDRMEYADGDSYHLWDGYSYACDASAIWRIIADDEIHAGLKADRPRARAAR